LVWNQDNVSR